MCACACSAVPGRAGRPPGSVLACLTFPVAPLSFFFVLPPLGLGRPVCCVFLFLLLCAPVVSGVPCFPARSALGLGVLFARPFFSFFLLLFFCRPPPCFFFSYSSFAFFLVFLFQLPCLLFCFFFPLRCVFFFGAGCAVRGRFVSLWLSGVLACGAVGAEPCGALCVLPGAVWRACAWLGSRALLSGAVLRWVLFGCFCCSLLSRAAVFSAVFFALFRAFPWWSVLFRSVWCSAVVRLAVWRRPVALRSNAGFCCAVPFGALPCRGASLGSVLCCLFCCGAWVASCLVCCCGVLLCSVRPWARCCVVLLCRLWSVCCRSLCRVSGRLPFRGTSCVVLCWCACVAALCAVLSRPSGAGWRCVLLPVVLGYLLFGLAVLCLLLVAPGVVFW